MPASLPIMLALALAALVVTGSPSEPVRVTPGATAPLRLPNKVSRVAVGDPGVADVHVNNSKELLVFGRKLGRTTLTLWAEGGGVSTVQVIVDDGKSDALGKTIRELVNPTLRVSTFNDRIVIDGKVDSLEELRRLHALVDGDSRVTVLAQVDPIVLPFIAQQITHALARQGMPEARAVAVGSRIILEGSVQDERDLRRAQLIAESYYTRLHGS